MNIGHLEVFDARGSASREECYIQSKKSFFTQLNKITVRTKWVFAWKNNWSFLCHTSHTYTQSQAASHTACMGMRCIACLSKNSRLLVGHRRLATSWQPSDSHPLGGTGLGCNLGGQRAARGCLPLSLLFYPLCLPTGFPLHWF